MPSPAPKVKETPRSLSPQLSMSALGSDLEGGFGFRVGVWGLQPGVGFQAAFDRFLCELFFSLLAANICKFHANFKLERVGYLGAPQHQPIHEKFGALVLKGRVGVFWSLWGLLYGAIWWLFRAFWGLLMAEGNVKTCFILGLECRA